MEFLLNFYLVTTPTLSLQSSVFYKNILTTMLAFLYHKELKTLFEFPG